MKKYLVFVPVYNEAASVEEIVSGLMAYKDIADILVIDDGSEDGTSARLERLSGIIVRRHAKNAGYGATLIEGFWYAAQSNYHYVITIDSDKQHQPKEIEKFIRSNEQTDLDIISGSRYLPSTEKNQAKAPPYRQKINERITAHINRLTGYQLTDAFCGFKLYKVQALSKLRLTETGYGMPLQLWLQAAKHQLRIGEIPVKRIYLDRYKGVAEAHKNIFRRYRYYLEIIRKETVYNS